MRSGTILTYSYPGKIANLMYADYLCVVSYILVNVVSTWALTVTTHRHTQVKPLFTYFHQYNLSWWKNGQKNKGLFSSNFGLSFEKVVPTTYLCWILIEEFLFYQSIDYYCLTRLSSMCFFLLTKHIWLEINPTIKCSLRSIVHMQFNHWVPRCLASINHWLQSILTRPLSSTNNRERAKKVNLFLS